MRVGTTRNTCGLARPSATAVDEDIHPSRRDEVQTTVCGIALPKKTSHSVEPRGWLWCLEYNGVASPTRNSRGMARVEQWLHYEDKQQIVRVSSLQDDKSLQYFTNYLSPRFGSIHTGSIDGLTGKASVGANLSQGFSRNTTLRECHVKPRRSTRSVIWKSCCLASLA